MPPEPSILVPSLIQFLLRLNPRVCVGVCQERCYSLERKYGLTLDGLTIRSS